MMMLLTGESRGHVDDIRLLVAADGLREDFLKRWSPNPKASTGMVLASN
jgi:hypothetical protein